MSGIERFHCYSDYENAPYVEASVHKLKKEHGPGT